MNYAGDDFARQAALQTQPPFGRVHLHLFVKSTYRICVANNDGVLTGSVRGFRTYWKVSTRPSHVCQVQGRCVLATIQEDNGG